MSLSDIKDNAPNVGTIKLLESLLEEARAGRVRTVVMVTGNNEDGWHNCWSIDNRNSRRRMIGELTLMHHDMLVNQSLADGDSVLSYALE